MRLEKCWFCSSTVYPGHGIQFNFKPKRKPRKVKWTKAYRRLLGKDMTKDSTFEFERKRNRPERHDRIRTEETLKAIKDSDIIRQRREIAHHKQRMKGKKSKMIKEARKELDQLIGSSKDYSPDTTKRPDLCHGRVMISFSCCPLLIDRSFIVSSLAF
ncbi:hypothetical protein MKX01_035520 [Papaver californicum]|nr:hypothetical protein MKX01_035520 [Papaver californicum]